MKMDSAAKAKDPVGGAGRPIPNPAPPPTNAKAKDPVGGAGRPIPNPAPPAPKPKKPSP
jgi:hypothetical protein